MPVTDYRIVRYEAGDISFADEFDYPPETKTRCVYQCYEIQSRVIRALRIVDLLNRCFAIRTAEDAEAEFARSLQVPHEPVRWPAEVQKRLPRFGSIWNRIFDRTPS